MTETITKREHVSATSGDVLESQIEKLRSVFPDVFVEGKIDFDKLKATLGAAAESGPGRFHFSWAGKDDALSLLQTPSRATLIPCPDESIDFDKTGNVFIEGDNLEVLKLLFKPYFGRVKLIYIDPPYNTGQDFVYPDNYADPLKTYLQLTGQTDAEGNLLTSNPETSGRYHSAWLSMMYPRVFLARQLLRDDGLIFVSIDDNESHHLRMLMNEIFGEENFVANIAWEKRYTRSNNAKLFYSLKDTLLVYRKSEELAVIREPRNEKSDANYSNPDNDPRGPWMTASYVNPATKQERPNLVYPIARPSSGESVRHPTHAWKYEFSEYERHVRENRLWWGKGGDGTYPRLKLFLSESEGGLVPVDLWDYKTSGTTDDGSAELKELFGSAVFDNPKPIALLRRILRIATNATDEHLVLDFFAGSGSTAQAVLAQNQADGGNRRFILVQIPEPTGPDQSHEFRTISEIGMERIRRFIIKARRDGAERIDFANGERPLDDGFKVFKLVEPHIRPWVGGRDRDPDAYVANLMMFNDPLVQGWRPACVLWELALREGLSLDTRFVSRMLPNGNTIYEMIDPDKDPPQTIAVCLDDKVAVGLSKLYELSPERLLIVRDIALDDTAAANLALQCRLKTI